MPRDNQRPPEWYANMALRLVKENPNIVHLEEVTNALNVDRSHFQSRIMNRHFPKVWSEICKILHSRGNNRIGSGANNRPASVYLHRWTYGVIVGHKIGLQSIGTRTRANQIGNTMPGNYQLLGYIKFDTRYEASRYEIKLQAEYSDFHDRNANAQDFFIFDEDELQVDEILSRDGWIDLRAPKGKPSTTKSHRINGSSQASLF